MEIRHEIAKALYQLGMLPSSSGEYSYLYEAVSAVVKDPDIVLKPLKSGLYRLVAEHCFVTESTVSKALSRAKKHIWENCNDDTLLSYFGYTADECDAPTTDVFVSAIANSISVSNGIENDHDSNQTKLIELIDKTLNKVGVPPDHRGYCYLRSAILLVVDDSNMIRHLTEEVYSTIAREHDITEQSVSVAIQHAIAITWERGNIDALNYYFRYSIQSTRSEPTDREFISMIADDIRLEIQNKF